MVNSLRRLKKWLIVLWPQFEQVKTDKIFCLFILVMFRNKLLHFIKLRTTYSSNQLNVINLAAFSFSFLMDKPFRSLIEPSWLEHLKDEFDKPVFEELETFLKEEYKTEGKIEPKMKDIFRWSHLCPLKSVKVVIIGQDPYPTPGQADGLCFSVNKNSSGKIPGSLRNIFAKLKQEYPEFKEPNHCDLSSWAKQG